LSIAVAAGIGLVIFAIIRIPILISVVGRAAGRNEKRAESEQDREHQERVSGEQRW
jgi:Sec-independent protein translocase protein TatA